MFACTSTGNASGEPDRSSRGCLPIARNQCLNTLRRSNRYTEFDETAADVYAFDGETPFARLMKSEQVELVNRFLKELSPEYREVLVLREYQNLSYDEIAAVTRNTVSSVKSRLFKARRKLGQFLQPWVEPEGEHPNPETPDSEFEPHHKPVLRSVS